MIGIVSKNQWNTVEIKLGCYVVYIQNEENRSESDALGDSRVNFRGFGIVTVNTGLGYSVSEVRGEEVE